MQEKNALHRRFGTSDVHGIALLNRILPPDKIEHFSRCYAGIKETVSRGPGFTCAEAGLNELFGE